MSKQLEEIRVDKKKWKQRVMGTENKDYSNFRSIQQIVTILQKFDPYGVLSAEDQVAKVENCKNIFEIQERLLMMSLGSKIVGIVDIRQILHVDIEDTW